jgi:hypothetical protein
VLFCGMTRATVRLEVVCEEANAWVVERLWRQQFWSSTLPFKSMS